METISVKDLMSTDLITLEKDETLDLAGEIMRLARIRHLPVVEAGQLVGLISHRDILRAQSSALAGLSPTDERQGDHAVSASDIMNCDVRTVNPNTLALDAATIMREHKYGCLPIVDAKTASSHHKGRLVGILTEADFLSLVIRALS